jgi:hypothetical protein
MNPRPDMPYGLYGHACAVYTMDTGAEAAIVTGGMLVRNQQSQEPEENLSTYRLKIQTRKGF